MKFSLPVYLPWIHSGISYFLLPSEARVNELRRLPVSAQKTPSFPQVKTAEKPLPTGGKAPYPFVRSEADRVTQSVVSSRTCDPPARSGIISSVPSISDNSPQRVIQKSPILQKEIQNIPAIPFAQWPDSWNKVRNRKELPPFPLVLWTYPGLANDLMETPDQKRRLIITNLLKSLRHKGGTHVFWPFDLPEEKGFTEADLFWSGVLLLKSVRHILLFGTECCPALNISPPLTPYSETRLYGKIILQFPRLESLSSSSFNALAAFLQRSLACYARQ